MAHFKYIGRSKSGERVTGVVEAPDRSRAAQQIEAMGQTPISINETSKTVKQDEAGGKKRFRFDKGFQLKPKMKMQELILFSREMSDLVASGMTIGRALHTLAARKTEGSVGIIVETLRNEIIQGTSFSDALELYPETFSTLYVNLVRAGEASGNLPTSLEHICVHYERVKEAQGKVMSAMSYPMIVMVVGALSVILMVTFIVPKFVTTFDEMGATLPKPTLFLMFISDLMTRYGLILLGVIAAGTIVFKKWISHGAGQRIWHQTVLRIPIVGAIITTNAYSHFARTLGTLLHNGVSVLPALGIVQKTIKNVIISDEIGKARGRITDGSSLSGPLAQGKIFPRLLIDMLAVGEETGDLAGSLGHVTRRYDSELDRLVQTCTTVLEPLLIVAVALVIGSIVIALLLPVLTLTDALHI